MQSIKKKLKTFAPKMTIVMSRITHHKSFLSISCFRISSLPFFLSNKNQPTIHHFDGAHAVPRKALRAQSTHPPFHPQ